MSQWREKNGEPVQSQIYLTKSATLEPIYFEAASKSTLSPNLGSQFG
jgi:hypothetical protein